MFLRREKHAELEGGSGTERVFQLSKLKLQHRHLLDTRPGGNSGHQDQHEHGMNTRQKDRTHMDQEQWPDRERRREVCVPGDTSETNDVLMTPISPADTDRQTDRPHAVVSHTPMQNSEKTPSTSLAQLSLTAKAGVKTFTKDYFQKLCCAFQLLKLIRPKIDRKTWG